MATFRRTQVWQRAKNCCEYCRRSSLSMSTWLDGAEDRWRETNPFYDISEKQRQDLKLISNHYATGNEKRLSTGRLRRS